MAIHPPIHPLHPLLRRAAKLNIKHHRSSLHNLAHSFLLNPSKIETIMPARQAPTSTTPYTTHIAANKDASITEHDNITADTRIYTDGSGENRKIGASAVLYKAGHLRKLCYHLGTEREHTVYEAEAVGMTLVTQLLLTEMDLDLPINIFVDNQAAIKSCDVLTVEILIYGLILFTLFHQSVVVALHCDSIMSYYSSLGICSRPVMSCFLYFPMTS
jgi:hypothetical protein